MPMHNAEIAAMLIRLADLLEIEGDNPFRVRAYRNAAQVIQGLSRSVADMIAAGEDLSRLPGIGPAICKKLQEMASTGHLGALEREEHHVPPTLVDLLKIPALGPKRVHQLYEKLGIATREQLTDAARGGKLRDVPGLGAKTEQKILTFLEQRREGEERTLLAVADEVVQALLEALRATPGVKEVTAAGSYRRRAETVGDLDIVATGAQSAAILQRFVGYDEVKEVLARGPTKASVLLRGGLQVDLRVVPGVSYGAALHYFTGSKAHNIAVRTRAVKRGLKINEYGVFRGGRRIAGRTEEEVYAATGLPFIPPELRENRGEIAAAEQHALPKLIEPGDIRGDLHVHTKESDGRATLEEMAAAAQAAGYEYMVVSDHSKRLTMAHGLNPTRLAQQIRAIDRFNAQTDGCHVLKATEVDILEDGSLDLPDDILSELDIVVGAVHYRFELSREKQTERILRALDNPLLNILAHPTGRLIGERAPYDVDMERILRAAAERGCALEINGQPARLDLNDVHCKAARDLGVRLALSTDAHTPSELGFMRYCLGQARRGWLTAKDVVNTLHLPDLRKWARP